MTRKNEFTDVFKQIDIRGPNECWPWLGYISSKGDPQFNVDGRKYAPYRVVRWLVDGDFNLLDARVVIRHKCKSPDGKPIDDRGCCNPNHLEQGSAEENRQDMMERGRSGLTEGAVADIIKMKEEFPELTHEQIASRIRYKHQCECARQTVTDILSERRRKVIQQVIRDRDKI